MARNFEKPVFKSSGELISNENLGEFIEDICLKFLYQYLDDDKNLNKKSLGENGQLYWETIFKKKYRANDDYVKKAELTYHITTDPESLEKIFRFNIIGDSENGRSYFHSQTFHTVAWCFGYECKQDLYKSTPEQTLTDLKEKFENQLGYGGMITEINSQLELLKEEEKRKAEQKNSDFQKDVVGGIVDSRDEEKEDEKDIESAQENEKTMFILEEDIDSGLKQIKNWQEYDLIKNLIKERDFYKQKFLKNDDFTLNFLIKSHDYDILNAKLKKEALDSYHKKDFQKTIKTLKKTFGYWNNPGICFLIAMLYLNKEVDQIHEAIMFFKRVLFFDKKNTDPLFYIGLCHDILNEETKAEKYFEKIIKSDNNNKGFHKYIGVYFHSEKKFNLSIKAFKKINDESFDPETFFFLGLGYLNVGDFVHAEANLGKAHMKIPANKEYLTVYGWILIVQRKYNKAIKVFKKGKLFEDINPVCLYYIGVIYSEKREFYNAILFFKESLELRPKNINAIRELSYSYYLLKKYSEAIKIIQEAILISKNNNDKTEVLILILSSYLKKQKKYNEALDEILKAKRINHSNSKIWFYTAHLEYTLKQNNAAINSIKQAIRFDYGNPKYWYFLALIYALNKQYSKSIISYYKVLIIKRSYINDILPTINLHYELKNYKKLKEYINLITSFYYENLQILKFIKWNKQAMGFSGDCSVVTKHFLLNIIGLYDCYFSLGGISLVSNEINNAYMYYKKCINISKNEYLFFKELKIYLKEIKKMKQSNLEYKTFKNGLLEYCNSKK